MPKFFYIIEKTLLFELIPHAREQWIIEFNKAPENIDEFAFLLDEALQNINSDYEAKRFNNMTLNSLKLNVARSGLFYDWLKKNDKLTLLKMLSLPITIRKQQRYTFDVEYDDICLLMRYLSSNRPFLKTFDIYLKQLAAVFQSEAGTNIRSKAMKCLCTVVEADPTILGRNDIKSCVKVGLTDKSISVREAAIDLIGRYIVHKQLLILQYYDVLCERSIDTGNQGFQ